MLNNVKAALAILAILKSIAKDADLQAAVVTIVDKAEELAEKLLDPTNPVNIAIDKIQGVIGDPTPDE